MMDIEFVHIDKDTTPAKLEEELMVKDSCYFSNGYYRWSSQGKGGKDALKFLQEVEGMEFLDAMKLLCELYNIEPTADTSFMNTFRENNSKRAAAIEAASRTNNENTEFKLPVPAENNKRVYAYLKSRGISDNVLKYCLNNKYIYQEANYGNCVFVGYDNEDIPKYAGLRSTGYKTSRETLQAPIKHILFDC